MLLTELFAVEDVVVGLDPADKWQAIRDLVTHLVARGRLAEERLEEVLDAVLDRERSMSTGMEHGVAIPHAAVDQLEEVIACLGVINREGGLPFESIDGQPASMVVLLVIPRAHKLLHIRTLADVARVLSKADVRAQLLQAKSSAEAHAALGQ
ncbi:MAG: mannitol/fructose-specific phosphotransferase system IIA component (Ntr-type) [Planctomycetota bacterium]|jgi:mannitol/fructose-specific phosphotransferase system IIA component (Ntr-type)